MTVDPHRRPETSAAPPKKERGVTPITQAPVTGSMTVRLTLRVDFGGRGALGPGKVRLLEAIAERGSIAAAAKSLGMSYRRAWLLIDSLNRSFRYATVTARPGGAQGGGAALTEFGRELVHRYRQIETGAARSAREDMEALEQALVPVSAELASPAAAPPDAGHVKVRAPRHRRGRKPG